MESGAGRGKADQVVIPIAWSSDNQLEAISFTGDFAIIANALHGSALYGEALSALCRIELELEAARAAQR